MRYPFQLPMITFDRSRRILFGALAFSLLLHLLALSAWDSPRPLPPVAVQAPLQAQVGVRALVTPAPAAIEKSAPLSPNAVDQAPPRPDRSRPPSLPSASDEAKPAAARLAESPLPASVPASAPTNVPASGAMPSPALAPPVAPAGGGDRVAAATVSADHLRQYRIDLGVGARRFRLYPAVARARGWEGVAEVSLSISAAASPGLRLSRSSGHAVLDEQALRMLAQAVEATPLPEGLRGRSFELTLPIRFSLED
ncbi:MAG TPA: TonB family protein [Azospira sp.]|nr:TonB family protein [Azospira sp.]